MDMEYRRNQQLHHQIHTSSQELLTRLMNQSIWTNRSKGIEGFINLQLGAFFSLKIFLVKEADKVYPGIETDNDRTVTVSGLSEYVIEPDQGKNFLT